MSLTNSKEVTAISTKRQKPSGNKICHTHSDLTGMNKTIAITVPIINSIRRMLVLGMDTLYLVFAKLLRIDIGLWFFDVSNG
jgi:hypothetical protein